MNLDLAKIKSDAEIIASRCDMLLMTLPVRDVLAILTEIEITETRLHEVSVLCATVEQERDQLKAENEALRKDAERYRWLRQRHLPIDGHDFLSTKEILDDRIDAKLAKERP